MSLDATVQQLQIAHAEWLEALHMVGPLVEKMRNARRITAAAFGDSAPNMRQNLLVRGEGAEKRLEDLTASIQSNMSEILKACTQLDSM